MNSIKGDVFENNKDDDNSLEWEDSVEDSDKSSTDEKTFFQRVDSYPHLTSRRSLITTMLQQKNNTPIKSRTSSPNGPSLACSIESDGAPLTIHKSRQLPTQPDIPKSNAQPIKVAHETALLPKITRHRMISSELTPSFRREPVSEHQTAITVQLHHTEHENSKLKQFPEKEHMGSDDKGIDPNSWNKYFGQDLGYHSKGW